MQSILYKGTPSLQREILTNVETHPEAAYIRTPSKEQQSLIDCRQSVFDYAQISANYLFVWL